MTQRQRVEEVVMVVGGGDTGGGENAKDPRLSLFSSVGFHLGC